MITGSRQRMSNIITDHDPKIELGESVIQRVKFKMLSGQFVPKSTLLRLYNAIVLLLHFDYCSLVSDNCCYKN